MRLRDSRFHQSEKNKQMRKDKTFGQFNKGFTIVIYDSSDVTISKFVVRCHNLQSYNLNMSSQRILGQGDRS